jgi:glycosyltransferase involved in cell wall biosynthesis
MNKRTVLITSPSLDTKFNVSGISSVTNFIIHQNPKYAYEHFELGRKDSEKRGTDWIIKTLLTTIKWILVVSSRRIAFVHFNFAFSKPSVIRDVPLILFAKLIGKKMLIHVHGGEFLLKKQPPLWMNILLKGVFTQKTTILVLSPLERNVLLGIYPARQIKVLPNCVDLTAAEKVHRQFPASQKLNLLFLGRIHADKGIKHIYQALAILRKRNIPFRFFMAGTGPEEKVYVDKFSALLGIDFNFCGIVSGAVKDSLLTDCDIFLLPSLYEGLPMALLESMSFGMVPVVTDIGSISTVVKNGQNGIILGSDPTQEIVVAVELLGKGNGILQRMSNHARDYIFSHFDPKKYIFYLNEIYDIV